MKSKITPRRIVNAFSRRLKNIPHQVAWLSDSLRGESTINPLEVWKNVHAGERGFILGNGPSLARTDVEKLVDETTFGLNRIYLLFEERGFKTDYFVSINDLVLEQSVNEISTLPMPKFLNWRSRKLFRQVPETYFLLERYVARFFPDPRAGLWGGATVTFAALQLAFYMGFQTIVLVGVDHSFSSSGTPHTIVTAKDVDIDHFHPKYFANGTRWQLPDLETSEYAYRLARQAFEADGRRVLDATIGGKLDIFPKVDFDSLF